MAVKSGSLQVKGPVGVGHTFQGPPLQLLAPEAVAGVWYNLLDEWMNSWSHAGLLAPTLWGVVPGNLHCDKEAFVMLLRSLPSWEASRPQINFQCVQSITVVLVSVGPFYVQGIFMSDCRKWLHGKNDYVFIWSLSFWLGRLNHITILSVKHSDGYQDQDCY